MVHLKGNIGAIVLIAVGVVALGTNLGLFELNLAALLRTWWPLLLIAIGVAMFFARETEGTPRNGP